MSRVKDEIAAKEAEISELEKSMNEGLSLVEKVLEFENELCHFYTIYTNRQNPKDELS